MKLSFVHQFVKVYLFYFIEKVEICLAETLDNNETKDLRIRVLRSRSITFMGNIQSNDSVNFRKFRKNYIELTKWVQCT